MNYYRNQSSWGTPQYQIAAPPQPTFVPQPSWGGRQYYRAYLGGPTGYDDYDRDEGFFDNIWGRIKGVFSSGVGREEAKHWHSRVYGGLVQVDSLLPEQIGAAAGFEAVRHWNTYRSTYRSPLADDRDREREALAGLAMGEAQKLISYAPRLARHKSMRREVAEVAAATAERIYSDDYDSDHDPYDAYESRSSRLRRRASSFSGDGYSPRSRRRSMSSYGRPLVAANTGGTYVSAQPTGVTYVSSGSPQPTYVSAAPTGQPYVTTASTGQYVTASSSGQYVTPGVQYARPATYVTTSGQPVQYVSSQPQYVQAQPQYVTSTGQPVVVAGQPGVQYAQPQYMQSTGATYVYPQQQQPAAYGQPMVMPQGYTRQRHLSTGGGYTVIR